jgi:hypothetical protein
VELAAEMVTECGYLLILDMMRRLVNDGLIEIKFRLLPAVFLHRIQVLIDGSICGAAERDDR